MVGCAALHPPYILPYRMMRNDHNLAVTREYIMDNPAQWEQDADNSHDP